MSKLATRCRKAIECYDLYRAGDYVAFWNKYVDNLMSEEDVAMYDAHRCGTMKLQSFYERLMNDMAVAYYKHLTGENSSVPSAFGVYNSLRAPQVKYMFDNDPETYYHSGNGQRTDDYVAVDLSSVIKVKSVEIVQGRNSVDDVDYFDHTVLEYSADGETWTALTEPLEGVYEIEWKGEPFMARYVGIRKLESKKRNWLAIRSFDINPVTEAEYGADSNPFTFLVTEGEATFAIKPTTKHITLLMGDVKADARCKVYDAEGAVIADVAVDKAILHLDVANAASLTLTGVDAVFECVEL